MKRPLISITTTARTWVPVVGLCSIVLAIMGVSIWANWKTSSHTPTPPKVCTESVWQLKEGEHATCDYGQTLEVHYERYASTTAVCRCPKVVDETKSKIATTTLSGDITTSYPSYTYSDSAGVIHLGVAK